MKHPELDRRIQRCFDGEAEDGEMLALREVLKRDPEARKLYFEHAGLHQALDYRLSRSRISETAGAMTEARLRLQARRSARISLIAAAAAVVIAAVALRLVLVPAPEPVARLEAANGSIFSVSRSGGETNSGKLEEGSLVRLSQGALELSFAHGSRAVILAPAIFAVQGPDRLRLDQGTAWFRIEKEGIGFEVTTPELRVNDLGTEFGIVAGDKVSDEVHVFEGRVRAASLNPLRQEVILSGGQSRASGPAGRLFSLESRPEAFLVRLPGAASDGLIVNGGFESGTPPPNLTYGAQATPALLPGWRFGGEITLVRATSEGRPGYGEREFTILSSTGDTQLGFNANLPGRPPAEDVTVLQSFATTPGREYEVSFEMGGVFFAPHSVEITAVVRGGAGRGGAVLARHVEERRHDAGHGYNPRVRFRFAADSSFSTLVLTETSLATESADPVIDNVEVREVE